MTKTTRRTAVIYFDQCIDGEMIGLDDDFAELLGEREVKKQLKAYAATLTTNRLTGFYFDGWYLHFKEVVEVDFDYHYGHPLHDHDALWGVKPQIDPKNACVSSQKLKKVQNG